ncbi:MAG TPA: M48 family metalloprotease [Nitrospira sp.]|nr:M48 family metalloprotease [Nitrospira sp.]
MASRLSLGLFTGPALVLFSVLTACVSSRQEVRPVPDQGDTVSMLARVQDVAFPLLLTSADWCPFDQEPTYGFLLADGPESMIGEGDAAGSGVVISHVHPRSPAASADLRPGDHIVEINTQNVTDSVADAVTGLVRRLTRARIQPLQLDIMRSGRRHRVHLAAVPSCQFSLQVLQTDQINGLSDGRQIWVTTGLLRFVRSDDELACVLAHEIAHNVLGHVQEARLQAMLNTLLGATVGEAAPSSAPPRSLEAQADYIGSYIMARAGYDLQAVRRVWQRLREIEVQQAAPGQSLGRSHPATDERLAAFEATVMEIEGKRVRGELLEPAMGKR